MKNTDKLTRLQAEYKLLRTAHDRMMARIPNREYTLDGKPTAWTRKIVDIEKRMHRTMTAVLALVRR